MLPLLVLFLGYSILGIRCQIENTIKILVSGYIKVTSVSIRVQGGLAIPNTTLVSNNNPIAANNQTASSAAGDVCGKSILSCTIRNNQVHLEDSLAQDEQFQNNRVKGCILPWVHMYGSLQGTFLTVVIEFNASDPYSSWRSFPNIK